MNYDFKMFVVFMAIVFILIITVFLTMIILGYVFINYITEGEPLIFVSLLIENKFNIIQWFIDSL